MHSPLAPEDVERRLLSPLKACDFVEEPFGVGGERGDNGGLGAG